MVHLHTCTEAETETVVVQLYPGTRYQVCILRELKAEGLFVWYRLYKPRKNKLEISSPLLCSSATYYLVHVPLLTLFSTHTKFR